MALTMPGERRVLQASERLLMRHSHGLWQHRQDASGRPPSAARTAAACRLRRGRPQGRAIRSAEDVTSAGSGSSRCNDQAPRAGRRRESRERDSGRRRRAVCRRRRAARRPDAGRCLVGRDRHRDARRLAARRPHPDGAARLGRRQDRPQRVSVRRRHGVDADRHDPDGRPARPAPRRRSAICPTGSSDQSAAVIGRTAYIVGGYTGVRAGSTRSSPGARAGARASSRTSRTRCATPR